MLPFSHTMRSRPGYRNTLAKLAVMCSGKCSRNEIAVDGGCCNSSCHTELGQRYSESSNAGGLPIHHPLQQHVREKCRRQPHLHSFAGILCHLALAAEPPTASAQFRRHKISPEILTPIFNVSHFFVPADFRVRD